MLSSKQKLFYFAEQAKGLDDNCRIKLGLFAAGVKPNTYVILKVSPKNLEEKYNFEKLLRESNIVYDASRPKSYEEIKKIAGNRIQWTLAGIWFGYDLFRSEADRKKFKQYVSLVRKEQRAKAAIVAGRLYGYPGCCINAYARETPEFIGKNYSYHKYFRRLHAATRNFPYASHTACSPNCAGTAQLNKLYKRAIKQNMPCFYREFNRKKKYNTDLIVDNELDVTTRGLNGKTVWPARDGHDYCLFAKKPFDGKYLIHHLLTKQSFVRGAVVNADVAIRRADSEIKIKKILPKAIKDIYHERRFALLGRAY